MKTTASIVLLLAAVLIMPACRRTAPAGDAVPRRYAYPRFEPYDTTSAVCTLADLTFRISDAALLTPQGKGWLDIEYPRYRATIHLTYTSGLTNGALAEAIGNRNQRMDLNLGEATATATDFSTPGGFICRTLTAPDALVTPVQFIAFADGGRMLSGAAVLADADAPADSVAPVIDELEREIQRMLRTLSVAHR